MSDPETSGLLVRDFERLDRVARALREDRRGFFTLVCGVDLLPAALAYLRETSEREVPDPVRMADSRAIVDCLISMSEAPPNHLVCISIDTESADVWRSLNWHRDKLVLGGRVILWLFSVEALQAFRRHAPDAYSFREAVLVLEGQRKSLPEGDWEAEGEPQQVRVARLLWELPQRPEEQALAGLRLVQALYDTRRDYRAAEAIAKQALALIPRDSYARELLTRSQLREFLIGIYQGTGQFIHGFRVCKMLLDEVADIEAYSEAALQARVYLSTFSPLGTGRKDAEMALSRLTPRYGLLARHNVHLAIAEGLVQRGRFRAAHDFLNEHLGSHSNHDLHAEMHTMSGHFKLASEALESAAPFHPAPEPTRPVRKAASRSVGNVLHLLMSQGEFAAAEKRMTGVGLLATIIHLKRGNGFALAPGFGAAIQRDLYMGHDGDVFKECECLVMLAAEARAAEAFSADDLEQILQIITSAGQDLTRYANKNPPWYDVLFPGLRAQILSQFGTRHDEAIAVATESVSLAHALWKDALPRSTRIFIQCLARAGHWDEMAGPVDDALKCARDEDRLIELAKVLAYEIARLLQNDAPKDLVDTTMKELQATFHEMDGPRIEGETWLEVAPYLPLTTASIDLVAIVDRIYELFSDMPMPENSSRCTEWLGDIYATRGDEKLANRCYRMALSELERYGILLRKPILEKKVAAGEGLDRPPT